ncbi:hypothetical protein QBC46DRAFT_369984 [Diplogelasinospora grovesii]|uniref:mRNA export factor GLE1 n=1 Tax=Diplogelasinospora grovesii TaxID=303347 RepID=A0AAN6S9U7_9PEZI|nr:hypothetical protein QBC46DRAFT_369984 [Diplogelasinospora grovesii]
MADSSPSRPRSYQWTSPQRSVLSDILNEDRNSEARHRLLLEIAKKEHDRIREEAERVYREHFAREEQKRILEAKRQEEERIRLEEQIAAERTKLNALKLKKVELPPSPKEPGPPEPAAATAPTPPSSNDAAAPASSSHVNGTTAQKPAASTASPFGAPGGTKPLFGAPPAAPSPLAPAKQTSEPQAPAAGTSLFSKAAGHAAAGGSPFGTALQNGSAVPPSSQTQQPKVQPSAQPQTSVDRYTVIHQNLKVLRKSMAEQAKTNRALKDRMGDMRREIRKTVGQLTGGAGANRQQQQKLTTILRESLANRVQSQLIDPSNFVLSPRTPVQGALNNEPQIPSLFVYLLNILAKATISQFINEAGARPETADPVGVCIAATFAEPEFQWCGGSLIDILMAKFRIVCPVLFGYRGSEKTEQGRQRIGWWKDGGRWIPEQQHMDRMTGLGAGFAAVSLRNFKTSKKANPYPPRNYWTAMAKIVNTPAAEISNTQCVVLKAMIQNYEHRFIEAYGTAAIAALRTSLLEFPARAPEKSAAVNSLQVLAQLLKRDTGLALG